MQTVTSKIGLLLRKQCNSYELCNASNGRVDRASASGVKDLGLISSRVKLMTVKLLFAASLLDTQH